MRSVISSPDPSKRTFLRNLCRTDSGGSFKYDGNFDCSSFLIEVFNLSRDLERSVKVFKNNSGNDNNKAEDESHPQNHFRRTTRAQSSSSAPEPHLEVRCSERTVRTSQAQCSPKSEVSPTTPCQSTASAEPPRPHDTTPLYHTPTTPLLQEALETSTPKHSPAISQTPTVVAVVSLLPKSSVTVPHSLS